MNTQRYLFLYFFFLIVSFIAAPCIGQISSPESAGISSDRLERLDQKMHEYVENGQLAGVQTAIYRRGKLVHFDTYGMADNGSKKELEENSLWRIYSMTKPIVSVGLMMLYEQGNFN